MRTWRGPLLVAIGIVLAAAAYPFIAFACRYGLVATIMTARIKVPGLEWVWVPYSWILSVAVCLVLYGSYLWMRSVWPRRRGPVSRGPDPLLVGSVGIGIALLGFLAVYYPCPVPIDVLNLWVPIAEGEIRYVWVFAVGALLIAYAVYAETRERSAPG